MEYAGGKILKFRETVIHDAADRRDAMLKKMENEKKEFLEKSETAVFEEIYSALQKKRTEITKKSDEQISRALSESKKRLLQKREGIIDSIFSELLRRIDEFKKTDAYENYLISSVKNTVHSAGEGDLTICIDESDSRFSEKITGMFGAKTEFEDITGGCRVINNTKHIICDNSLSSGIENLKNGFLERSGLIIN